MKLRAAIAGLAARNPGFAALIAAVVVVLAGGPSTASADAGCTLYAAPAADGGNDANPGTKAQPKESPIVLLGVLTPGQTGCLKDGALFELGPGAGQSDAKGAPGQPITLRPETAGARATLRASSGFAFVFASHDIVLKDLDFRRPSPGTGGSLFQLNGDRITLDGVDASYPDNICLDIGGDPRGSNPDTDSTDDVVIRRSRIHGCGSAYGGPKPPEPHDGTVAHDAGVHGIYASFTRRLVIEDSLIYANNNRGIQLYPDADGTIIRRNVLHANGANLNIGSEPPSGPYSENNLIENNILTDSVLSGLAPGGFVGDTSEVVGNFPLGASVNNQVNRNCISNTTHTDHLHEGYGVTYGDNIENQNPGYANAAAGNFTLTDGSPCAGKGPAEPVFGTPRRFYTVTPCRAIDTRDNLATNPFAGPLGAGGSRDFPFRGLCGVALSASAVSANVTVTEATAAGDLRVYPLGAALPESSTINYGPGQTRANNAILGLSSFGRLTVRSDQVSGTVHVIVDVTGYFQ